MGRQCIRGSYLHVLSVVTIDLSNESFQTFLRLLDLVRSLKRKQVDEYASKKKRKNTPWRFAMSGFLVFGD